MKVSPAALIAGTVFQDTLKDGSKGPEMVVIPAGKFWMGSDKARDAEADEAELPRHRVLIAKPFAMGKHQVTFEDYDRYAEASGRERPAEAGWGRGTRPVISVSWEEAVAYAKWLSEQTGKRYRLPTESEWEYAARAGSATRYWWGDDVRQDGHVWANCADCGSEWDGKQAPVGSFEPNPWGLHDMLGNVLEWVQDCWHDEYQGAPEDGSAWEESDYCARRVVRGSGFGLSPGSRARALPSPRDCPKAMPRRSSC